MIPYFSYTQINLGPVTLYTWGLFLGMAFLVGSWLVLREAAKKGIEQKNVFWLIIFIFVGGLVGSRLAYILQFPKYYLFHPLEIFQVWAAGLMFYGGLLGAGIAGWLYLKYIWNKDKAGRLICLGKSLRSNDRVPSKSKRPALSFRIFFLQIADIFTPAIALGIFISRIGCSLINDHQGAITNLPWAILWPDGALRHPVAGYLALNGLIMFLVLWFLRSRLKKPGQLFIIFLFWYCLSRFFLDFTRATDTILADPDYLGLFISQWISLFIIGGLFIYLKRQILTK